MLASAGGDEVDVGSIPFFSVCFFLPLLAIMHWLKLSELWWIEWWQQTFLSCDLAAAAAAKSLQSCPTLCDPIDSSPRGTPVPRILQAKTLEWVVISFSNVGKWKVKVKLLSHVRLFATPWTAAYQAPLSMGFSRQEYWSGVPSPSPLVILGKSFSLSPLNMMLPLLFSCYTVFDSFMTPWTMAWPPPLFMGFPRQEY